MRVVVDTNVVLDVLLDRAPFSGTAQRVLALAETARVEAYLGATTLTTLDYLLHETLGRAEARAVLRRLLGLFEVAAVNRRVIERALESPVSDFEDAVLVEAGRLVGAEVLVTRNGRDFAKAGLRVLDPAEFLAQFE